MSIRTLVDTENGIRYLVTMPEGSEGKADLRIMHYIVDFLPIMSYGLYCTFSRAGGTDDSVISTLENYAINYYATSKGYAEKYDRCYPLQDVWYEASGHEVEELRKAGWDVGAIDYGLYCINGIREGFKFPWEVEVPK